MDIEQRRVLVYTQDKNLFSSICSVLMPPTFEIVICNDQNKLRREVCEILYDIIIIDSNDGDNLELSIDISNTQSSIILLTTSHLYDEISYRVEIYGILALIKPFDFFSLYSCIKSALAMKSKVEKFSMQTIRLKERMDEIKIINQAKLILIQNKNMTEQEAHRYIEKSSMDTCTNKLVIADQIIKENS